MLFTSLPDSHCVPSVLQRMSGIATATAAMVQEAKASKILETRKTVPGLRLLDKWAVLIGAFQK